MNNDPQPFGLTVGNAFAGHAARAVGNERKAAQYDNALTDLVNIAIARAAARRSLELTTVQTPMFDDNPTYKQRSLFDD